MHNKRSSSTSIRLPRLLATPSKTADKPLRKLPPSPQTPSELSAQSYGIYDPALQPLAECNRAVKREIASLTKMMTLLCSVRLCRKYKISMGKCYFRVTPSAASTRGTTAELQSREWITIEDLLHGLMLPSGNDAATALGENLGACLYYDRLGESQLLTDLKSLDLTQDARNIKLYTEQFVKHMNFVARELGMKNTLYANPHGLDCAFRLEAYSTVEDQLLLTHAVMQLEECVAVMRKREHVGELKTISGKEVEVRKVLWQSTNLLLGEDGFVGGKTGQTQLAGNCLASLYQTPHKEKYIIILLGCGTKEARFSQTRHLVHKYVKQRHLPPAIN